MRKFLLLPLLFVCSLSLATPPTRVSSYVAGDSIVASEVTENEDALFNYLQAGVDAIKDGTVTNADINGSANIQSDKLNLTAIAQDIANTGTLANTGNVTFTGDLSVSGKIDLAGTIDTNEVYVDGKILIPSGIIVMWSGAVAAIPEGWELSDGTCTNTCPDFRDKFIVGAGSTYAVAATGGATTHTHTATGQLDAGPGGTAGVAEGGNYDNTLTATTASASSLPPYYALCFIIKI